MIIKRTFRFEKLTDCDHEINASVNFFHEKFNVWPNILMANEYALRIINFLANCKQENIRNDDNKTPDKPYVILGSFASENYTLDFCVDGQMPDNSFVLIFDDDPDGAEPIPKEDTELPKEHIHAQGNHGHGYKITGSAFHPITHLEMTPPTSTGRFENLESELAILLKDATETPFLVDHSAVDSYAFLIEANGKRIFYSGDFRAHGNKSDLFKHIVENPPHNIDVLFMEGTMMERHNDQFPAEKYVKKEIYEVIKNQKNISFIISSSTNIDRIVSAYNACHKTSKILVLEFIYSMDT